VRIWGNGNLRQFTAIGVDRNWPTYEAVVTCFATRLRCLAWRTRNARCSVAVGRPARITRGALRRASGLSLKRSFPRCKTSCRRVDVPTCRHMSDADTDTQEERSQDSFSIRTSWPSKMSRTCPGCTTSTLTTQREHSCLHCKRSIRLLWSSPICCRQDSWRSSVPRG
jgi:hypothetical protein